MSSIKEKAKTKKKSRVASVYGKAVHKICLLINPEYRKMCEYPFLTNHSGPARIVLKHHLDGLKGRKFSFGDSHIDGEPEGYTVFDEEIITKPADALIISRHVMRKWHDDLAWYDAQLRKYNPNYCESFWESVEKNGPLYGMPFFNKNNEDSGISDLYGGTPPSGR